MILTKQTIEEMCWVNPGTSCWEWQGARNSDGYGSAKEFGKGVKLHRRAWEIWRGDIPEGLSVLHHCDVPYCCNPAHLFLGTQADNMQDCAKKGRIVAKSGIFNSMSRLTAEQVKAIRSMPGTKVSIAAKFGVSDNAVRKIKLGLTYKEI